MRVIAYVPQRRGTDCGVAALAMATGRSYEPIALDFAELREFGLDVFDLIGWLGDNGFSIRLLFPTLYRFGAYRRRDPWPPAPFAPAHIACVHTARGGHWVVMDEGGRVLDPARPGDFTLVDYPLGLMHVIGIWESPA